MDRVYTVFLMIESSRDFERGLLRGIYKYSAMHANWQICHMMPQYVREAYAPVPNMATAVPEVDGLIMRVTSQTEPLLSRDVPKVLFSDCGQHNDPACHIVTDDRAMGEMGAEYFLKRGYKHYAFLGFHGIAWSNMRYQGYTQALAQVGFDCLTCDLPDQKKLTWDREQTRIGQWLRMLPKPVALFACNDDRARQCVDACRHVGLAVPEDVAILGVDDDEFMCHLSNPTLSSIALNVEEAGFQAAQQLDRMMQGQVSGSPEDIVTTPTRVIVRQSSDVSALQDTVVAEAVRYIQAHCDQSIQVSDVVHHVAVSRKGLYERFKRSLHCSVHQYIKKVRVEQIEKLLLETEYSIADISNRLDFTSPDHIAAYFCSLKGITPLKFRKMHKS